MGNFNTIDSITDNLEAVLKTLGACFSTEAHDDLSAIPAGLLPLGQVFYEGEGFEYVHGQKSSYASAEFLIRVILSDRDPRLLTREEQKWVHLIRDGLTVDALNIGALAASKLISMVATTDVRVNHGNPAYGVVSYKVSIRYREI